MTAAGERERIGNYRVLRELGRGATGVVYEAVDESIDRRVAVKVLTCDLGKNPELRGRFFNEARAANIIRHPGIVSISELGHREDGAPFIVMEYLEGESLGARMQRGPVKAAALRLARQIGSALAAAHDRGVVHRDLKPDNVMLVPDPDMPGGERVKVLDFGIAKLAEEHQREGAPEVQTRTGTVLGTPTYMSPEQCQGARGVNDRADVYSLGVLLYRMLAGRPPFSGPGAAALLAMHIYETPPPLRELDPAIPEEVAALVQEMLGKEPPARPAMAEVVARLDRLLAARAGDIGDEPTVPALDAAAAPAAHGVHDQPTHIQVQPEPAEKTFLDQPPTVRALAQPDRARAAPPLALLLGGALLLVLCGVFLAWRLFYR